MGHLPRRLGRRRHQWGGFLSSPREELYPGRPGRQSKGSSSELAQEIGAFSAFPARRSETLRQKLKHAKNIVRFYETSRASMNGLYLLRHGITVEGAQPRPDSPGEKNRSRNCSGRMCSISPLTKLAPGAQTMSHDHGHSSIRRISKPSTSFLNAKGQIKLNDFGNCQGLAGGPRHSSPRRAGIVGQPARDFLSPGGAGRRANVGRQNARRTSTGPRGRASLYYDPLTGGRTPVHGGSKPIVGNPLAQRHRYGANSMSPRGKN